MIEKPDNQASVQINSTKLTFKVGKFAPQANASVLAQIGETIVLATVVSSAPREDLDYFPLYVEYQEKLYAGGKIKGSRWVKREGRPSDEAILTARLIDRSIRPLFPEDYKNEVQVVITVLSVDAENDPDVLAICATSAALAISDIPWQGPVGAVRIGLKEGNFFANPVYQERNFSDLDLVVVGTEKSIVMVEVGARQVVEEEMIKALEFGQKQIKKVIDTIKDLAAKVGQKKQPVTKKKIKAELVKKVEKLAKVEVERLIKQFDQKPDLSQLEEIKKAIYEEMEEESKKEIGQIVDQYFKAQIRKQILEKGKRADGRKAQEIRPLCIEVGILPRTHGSAVFQRGLTQALTITTLGSPSLEQLIEGMEGEETKRYIHHYYMPPFSVGEVGRFGWPSRREVGHGSLAERALEPVIPSEEKFPYTIRVVSEIMSSNGSTSMASVCGSSLSLMDAGVPISKPVAGIAMGLVEKLILTDITGIEDHVGDMDFKVAGTKEGITALQMDVKTLNVNLEILAKGLLKAKEARIYILNEMSKILPVPRSQLSKYAPRISVLHIDKEKIGDVIGPGGRMIRAIINETGVAMDVDDDGSVTISGIDPDQVKRAIDWVDGLTREVQAGETFEGEVKRILPFGAFVEILPGKEGLVHISEMSDEYVGHPSDIVEIGKKVKVRVKEIDDMGRINLSMLFGEKVKRTTEGTTKQRRPGRFSSPRPKKRF